MGGGGGWGGGGETGRGKNRLRERRTHEDDQRERETERDEGWGVQVQGQIVGCSGLRKDLSGVRMNLLIHHGGTRAMIGHVLARSWPIATCGKISVEQVGGQPSTQAYLSRFRAVKGATAGPRKQTSAGQGLIHISVTTETGESCEGRCAGVSRSAK